MAETLHFAGGNNITLSTATAANHTTVTISGANVGGAQTGISGISNSEVMYTSGTVKLSGTNNVTVFSTTGQAFVVSGANTHAQQTGISSIAGSNTTYTAGLVEFTGSNIVTVRSSANSRLVIDASQSVQTQGITVDELSVGLSNIGNTAGNTTVQTGNRLVFSGQGQVTLSQATGAGSTTIGVSIPNSHAQQTAISGLQNTETTYTSGTVELEGTNNITVFSTTGQRFRISGANTHAQQTGISSISASNTEYTSGRVVFTGSNMVTVKSSAAGQTIILDATQTNQSAIKALGASNTGNTAGNTGVSTGIDWVIAGTNNITVSESTAAGGPNTLWLSAPNAGGAGQFSAGVSTGGNTAGATGITGTRLVFVGTNSISLSQTTDANGGTITFDANPKQFSAGVSTGGNTAGSTGVTGTRLVFVGTDGMTLSQSTDANGGTISLDPGPKVGFFANYGLGSVQPIQTQDWSGLSQSWHVMPVNVSGPFPGVMTINTMYMRWSQSGSTATMSQANSSSVSVALYTYDGTQLTLINSASTSWGTGGANANNSTSTVNKRWMSIHSSLWSVQPTLSRGNYYFAWAFRTSSISNQTQAILGMIPYSPATFSVSGTMGVATQAANSAGHRPWFGFYTSTSNSPPVSMASNHIDKTGVGAFMPILVLNDDQPASF